MRNFASSVCFFHVCFLTEKLKSRWKKSGQYEDLLSSQHPTIEKPLMIDMKKLPTVSWLNPADSKYFAAVLPKLAANGSSQQMRQRVNGANKDVKPQ